MRLELKGEGQPDPIFALPDPGSDSTIPALVLNLPNGVPFLPDPYFDQGYNRYEVWCVGGAGGSGGNGGGRPPDPGNPPFTVGDFAYQLSWPYYLTPDPGRPGFYIEHYHNPYLANICAWGGAGGGGGLHVISGLLSVLPESCPVVVGSAGANAPVGQVAGPSPFTPNLVDIPNATPGDVYDLPHATFSPPVTGGDGGASSFNGNTCRASGGKGGYPSTIWMLDSEGGLHVDGRGGDGGCGGRTTPGGGAPGSQTMTSGPDGVWDGVLGKGGGGGRGGFISPPDSGGVPYTTLGDGVVVWSSANKYRTGSNGARGSYGFADPTVYGDRGIRKFSSGEFGFTQPVIAGEGGGARANRALPYGSYVSGFNPNGVVLIRLSRVE